MSYSMLLLRIESPGPKTFRSYSNKFGQAVGDNEKEDSLLFHCDSEHPIRSFTINTMRGIENLYITCQILHKNILILCKPLLLSPIVEAIKREGKPKALEWSGVPVNAEYPNNEHQVPVSLIIKKDDRGRFYVKSVKCVIPTKLFIGNNNISASIVMHTDMSESHDEPGGESSQNDNNEQEDE